MFCLHVRSFTNLKYSLMQIDPRHYNTFSDIQTIDLKSKRYELQSCRSRLALQIWYKVYIHLILYGKVIWKIGTYSHTWAISQGNWCSFVMRTGTYCLEPRHITKIIRTLHRCRFLVNGRHLLFFRPLAGGSFVPF